MTAEGLPGAHNLELQVYGNVPNQEIAQEQFNGLMTQYAQAVDRRDSESILRIETEMDSLMTAYSGLRALIAENHLDKN